MEHSRSAKQIGDHIRFVQFVQECDRALEDSAYSLLKLEVCAKLFRGLAVPEFDEELAAAKEHYKACYRRCYGYEPALT